MKINNKKHMDTVSDNKSPFIKIEEGEKKVRIMSDIHAVKEHNVVVEGKRRFIACPTENIRMGINAGTVSSDVDIPPCPLCELAYPCKTSYLAIAVDRDEEEAGVLKKGPTLMGAIQGLKDDVDWGDSTLYDIKIIAEGKDLDRKYSVNPIPANKSKELTEGEQLSLETFQEEHNLEVMTTPRNYDEIKKIIGNNFPMFKKA